MERRMRRELRIGTEPIDETVLVSARKASNDMGAVVYFTGIVRGSENALPIASLEYETFHKMAEHQFQLLFDEMEKRWPLESIRLVHRVRVIPVNQPSLWVEIVAPHR